MTTPTNPITPEQAIAELEGVVKEHDKMRAAYEYQNVEGLPYGPCQCYLCVIANLIRRQQADIAKKDEALRELKSACVDVLLPTINKAIKQGFKMETWTPEQMQWANAVRLTEEALSTTNTAAKPVSPVTDNPQEDRFYEKAERETKEQS